MLMRMIRIYDVAVYIVFIFQPPEKEVTAILPLFRVNAYTRPTVGTHTATHDGVYEIMFDNAYSRYVRFFCTILLCPLTHLSLFYKQIFR